MAKYICTVCGYIYDENEEGVAWDALPDDYLCPECGVPKDEFEKLSDEDGEI